MPNDWMIYGREKGKKKFRAFDGSGFTDKLDDDPSVAQPNYTVRVEAVA